MFTIVRVAVSKYELMDSDDNVVKTYNKTEMVHPSDWLSDAEEFGGDPQAILSGDWEYIDDT